MAVSIVRYVALLLAYKEDGACSFCIEGGDVMTDFEMLAIVLMLMSIIVTILLHFV